MASGKSSVGDVVEVVVFADDHEHVRDIRDGFTRTFEPTLRGPMIDAMQAVLAGSISLRLLVGGLVAWTRTAGGIMLVAEWHGDEGRWTISRADASRANSLLLLGPGGASKGPYDLSKEDSELGQVIEAMKSIMRGTES
jgi:hypothetical protein